VPSEPLQIIARISLALAVISAVVIAADIAAGRRQPMAIMNIVWPLTALYAGPLALLAYWRLGRQSKHSHQHPHQHNHHHNGAPRWRAAFVSDAHCGAGCMLGDCIADTLLFVAGANWLLGSPLLTSYVIDFIAAYLLGILFQYFAIAPMRKLPPGRALAAAIKADTLSLVAFQVGMYIWMAVYQKLIFHPRLEANSAVFWFMMQLGMVAGFATSFPMNMFLIKIGIKEAM
jgi:hypothetical protein